MIRAWLNQRPEPWEPEPGVVIEGDPRWFRLVTDGAGLFWGAADLLRRLTIPLESAGQRILWWRDDLERWLDDD